MIIQTRKPQKTNQPWQNQVPTKKYIYSTYPYHGKSTQFVSLYIGYRTCMAADFGQRGSKNCLTENSYPFTQACIGRSRSWVNEPLKVWKKNAKTSLYINPMYCNSRVNCKPIILRSSKIVLSRYFNQISSDRNENFLPGLPTHCLLNI